MVRRRVNSTKMSSKNSSLSNATQVLPTKKAASLKKQFSAKCPPSWKSN
jgi:hypothetical protein